MPKGKKNIPWQINPKKSSLLEDLPYRKFLSPSGLKERTLDGSILYPHDEKVLLKVST